MSAYVLVELQVLDEGAKAKYSATAGPLVQAYGGEFVVGGAWKILAGEAGLPIGIIIRFPDREKAMEWYNSAEYQALLAERARAMVCRFRLLG